MEIFDATWVETRENNSLPPPSGFKTGEDAGDVKLTLREMMAALKREWNWSHPTRHFGGFPNQWTLAPTTALPSYNEQQTLAGVLLVTAAQSGLEIFVNVSGKGAKTFYVPTRRGYEKPGYLVFTFPNLPLLFRYDAALDAFVSISQLGHEILDEEIVCPLTSESGAVSVGTGKFTFRTPYPFKITGFTASLVTPQTSGSLLTLDMTAGAGSLFGTKPTFDNGEKTTVTAATPFTFPFGGTGVNDQDGDNEFSLDVTQIGDGTAKGLKVTLVGHQL